MGNELQDHLKQPGTWQRIFFMLIFAVIIGFVRIMLWALVLFQVVSALLTGAANPNALKFGKVLSDYLYQILLFLTYNTDNMPFPFSEWGEASVVVERRARRLEE
jgi:hypothetical protein